MIPHRRRGACPSLAAPMQTGDGFLARLNIAGQTVLLDAALALCEAAQQHGNGIIEVTSRGSVQVRGLTAESVPSFIQAIEDIGIAVSEGVPIAVNPLAGLAADEAIDAEALAVTLRSAIRTNGLSERLAPKVAVAIDGGGALHLDALSADIRVRAVRAGGDVRLLLAMGGTAESAVPIGVVGVDAAVDAVVRLLKELATHGDDARARQVIRLVGSARFRATIADLQVNDSGVPDSAAALAKPPRRPLAAPIGRHLLRDGTWAMGVGLPFGKVEAADFVGLIAAAKLRHAVGLRVAPDRALLIVGVRAEDAAALAAQATTLDFITWADDPRRAIAACPGAPFCACTDVPMRRLAPDIAGAAAALLDGSLTMHLSGCAKGCAHQGPTALTVVGTDSRCGVVLGGAARDRPVVTLAPESLGPGLARLAQACTSERLAGEGAAAVLARLGHERVAAILTGDPA